MGVNFFIDETEVVINDGYHGSLEESGKSVLKKGYHKIKVQYFDNGGGKALKISKQPGEETRNSCCYSLSLFFTDENYTCNTTYFTFLPCVSAKGWATNAPTHTPAISLA